MSNTLNVTVAYLPEWQGLLAATLSPDTPKAPDDVQDDDPTPYKHDRRIWFEPVPDQRNRTHMAVLSLESDHERYRLYFSLQELPDDKLPHPVIVYRCPLDELKEQVFSFPSSAIVKLHSPINQDLTINVRIVEAKTVS